MSSGNSLWRRARLAAFAASLALPAYSREFPEVPLFSKEDAMKIVRVPMVHMLDDSTCEWIEGALWFDAEKRAVLTSGVPMALFRKNEPKEPIFKGVSREDAVFVARFPAKAGDIFYSTGYMISPRNGKGVSTTRPIYGVCANVRVQVGDVQTIKNPY